MKRSADTAVTAPAPVGTGDQPGTGHLPYSPEKPNSNQSDVRPDIGSIREILRSLIRLQNHLRLYGGVNTLVEQATGRLIALFDELFTARGTITVAVAPHGFLYTGRVLETSDRHLEAFARTLFQHGIAGMNFHAGVDARSLHEFLHLVGRKPSETWNEGGIGACLRARHVDSLTVKEMGEGDFLLTDRGKKGSGEDNQGSAIWQKFASTIFQALPLPAESRSASHLHSPASLAVATSEVLRELSPEKQVLFARGASRFLLLLRNENPRSREQAVKNLAEFAASLSLDQRRLFLNQVLELDLGADLAEGFLTGLSDQMLLDALGNSTSNGKDTPPLIISILGSLVARRGLADPRTVEGKAAQLSAGQKAAELFRPDSLDQFVPAGYQQALRHILRDEKMPSAITANLEALKGSLDQNSLDEHMGSLLFEILRIGPDQKHVEGVSGRLILALDFYLSTDNFQKVIELLRAITASADLGEAQEYISSPRFTSAVLDRAGGVSKEQQEEIAELIRCRPAIFISPLLDRLGAETSRSARFACLRYLKEIGPECIDEARRRLADSRWFVIRNMITLLHEFGDPSVLPDIRGFLHHRHPKVQGAALKACLLFRDQVAVAYLLQALDARDEAELLPAITLASLADDPQVTDRLLELVQRSPLLGYRLEVRKAAVRALAAAAPNKALPVLAGILRSRSLLSRRLHEDLKLEIVNALEKYPAEQAGELLREQVRSGSPKIARLAKSLLSKQPGEGPSHEPAAAIA